MALSTIAGTSGAIQGSVAQAIEGRRTDLKGRLFELALLACLFISLLALLLMIAEVVRNGVPVYTERGWDFLNGGLSSTAARAGIAQGIIGSFWIAATVCVVSIPLGVGAAVYLEEYAPRNRLTSFIEINVRNLAGVPSVVYGLLGLALFVEVLGGFSGRTTPRARPSSPPGSRWRCWCCPSSSSPPPRRSGPCPIALREGAYGVGATRWEVIRSQVLPYAMPGIVTGSLLAIARAVGEAAPLILVGALTGLAGRSPGLSFSSVLDPSSLTERFTAMPTIITAWSRLPDEDFKIHNTAAAILGMLVFVLVVNTIAILLRNRFEKKRVG